MSVHQKNCVATPLVLEYQIFKTDSTREGCFTCPPDYPNILAVAVVIRHFYLSFCAGSIVFCWAAARVARVATPANATKQNFNIFS